MTKKLTLLIVPFLGALYLKLVKLTGTYRVEGGEHLESVEKGGRGSVWVVWHNRLIGAIILHRGKNVGALISQSYDGELIARVVERLGYTALRGSTTRGGAGALKAVLRHIRAGHAAVFTPDGPKGPRYEVQQGAAYAAMKAGVPVLPLGVAASGKKVFRSWDRFQLPLPFSKVQVVYGVPLTFTGDEDVDEVREKIRAALTRATEEADRLLGVHSP